MMHVLGGLLALAPLAAQATGSAPFDFAAAKDAAVAHMELCAWCEAGDSTCDWEYDAFTQDAFALAISPSLGGRKLPYWRPTGQPSLAAGSKTATLAIMVHHGAARNAENYTSYMTNAVINAGLSLNDVFIVGPQVYYVGDQGLDESRHLWWDTMDDDNVDPDGGIWDWKWGGNSTAMLPASVSSFEYLDEILLALGDKARFPKLERIVFAGHSSGGQIMQRYALYSRVSSPEIGLPIKYFVANPSDVTYLGPERPVEAAYKDCDFCVNSTISATTANKAWTFEVPAEDSGCASTYDTYGYGLQGVSVAYLVATGNSAAVAQYRGRDVTYLAGSSDVCDQVFMVEQECDATLRCVPEDGGLDTSCEAEAQGWCRMARLHAFAAYVKVFYSDDAVHDLVEVPGVGHSGCGMFQSAEFAAAALLPKTPKNAAALK